MAFEAGQELAPQSYVVTRGGPDPVCRSFG